MRKKIAFGLLALLACSIPVALGCLKAYRFRQSPGPSKARRFFASISPHNVPACLMVLKRGTPAYDHDLRAWLYQPDVVRNNPWNRWLLQRDAMGLRENEIHLLASYPLQPGPALLPRIREALQTGKWSALALLRRIDDAHADQVFHEWTEQSLTAQAGTSAFLDSLPFMVGWPNVPLTGLLQRFWPQLTEAQRAIALATIARFSGEAVEPPADLLPFLDQTLRAREVQAHGHSLAVLGHFLARPATRDAALALLERESPRIRWLDTVENIVSGVPPGHLPFEIGEEYLGAAATDEETMEEEGPVEPESPARLSRQHQLENGLAVYRRLAERQPSLAVEALHCVAHLDIRQAEELAKPAMAGPDSELRKGAIVILIRHDSALGRRSLDEAFKGDAPRWTRFENLSDYIYGSKAAENYRRIARHDYLEVGKSWPPAASTALQWNDEAFSWPQFIAEYPWFPGTDDAYYRLAFARYATGWPDEALATVLEYFQRVSELHPDRDAEPYLRFLVRMIAYSNLSVPAHADLIAHLRALLSNPPGLFLLEENPEIAAQLAALDWFAAREGERKTLGVEARALSYLRRLTEIARLPPGAARLRQAMTLLQRRGISAPEWLYGRFSWLEEVQSQERVVEFAGETMREAASRLSLQLLSASAEGDSEYCLALVDWLAMHEDAFSNDYWPYDEWKDFTPLFEQIARARTSGSLCPSRVAG